MKFAELISSTKALENQKKIKEKLQEEINIKISRDDDCQADLFSKKSPARLYDKAHEIISKNVLPVARGWESIPEGIIKKIIFKKIHDDKNMNMAEYKVAEKYRELCFVLEAKEINFDKANKLISLIEEGMSFYRDRGIEIINKGYSKK